MYHFIQLCLVLICLFLKQRLFVQQYSFGCYSVDSKFSVRSELIFKNKPCPTFSFVRDYKVQYRNELNFSTSVKLRMCIFLSKKWWKSLNGSASVINMDYLWTRFVSNDVRWECKKHITGVNVTMINKALCIVSSLYLYSIHGVGDVTVL